MSVRLLMRANRIRKDSLLKRLIEHAFVNENWGNFKRRLPRYLCLNRLCKHKMRGGEFLAERNATFYGMIRPQVQMRNSLILTINILNSFYPLNLKFIIMKTSLEKYVTFYIILAQIPRIKNAKINYLYVDLSLPEEL